MVGIVDIGSNTIRLSCYETEGSTFHCVMHKKEVAGLAGYIDSEGRMTDEGIERVIKTLDNFKSVMQHMELESVHFLATAAIRNTVNSEEIVSKIKKATGFEVEVISGKEEAICDFAGVRQADSFKNGMVVDIGGGSTELVSFEQDTILNAVSVSIGSLNTYREFVKNIIPEKNEIKAIKSRVKMLLEKAEKITNTGDCTYGVGGSVRAILRLYNEEYKKDESNRIMEIGKLKKLLRTYIDKRHYMTDKIIKTAPERLHTIVPGLIILCTVMKYYGLGIVQVSMYGVREGYLIRHVLTKEV